MSLHKWKDPWEAAALVDALHPSVRLVLDPNFLASPVNWDIDAETCQKWV